MLIFELFMPASGVLGPRIGIPGALQVSFKPLLLRR